MKGKKIFLIAAALAAFLFLAHAGPAGATSSLFTSDCSGCHSVSTCAGCHAHGVHSSSAKSDLNLSASTDKTSYQPGESMSVTINGGYRSGWVRAILYSGDPAAGGVEITRSTGPSGIGGGSSFPITLTAAAPAAAGSYTYYASWYGNQYDKTGAFFGTKWRPDPNNPDHGEEFVALSFTVAGSTPPPTAPSITVTDSVAPTTDLQIPFGTITTNTTAAQTVTVKNDGSANLVIGAIGSANPLATPFSLKNDTCSNQTILPAASCTLSVEFAPTVAGAASDSFSIPSNDTAKSTVTVSVNGSGGQSTAPRITITDSVAPTTDLQLPFGSVTTGASAAQTVTVKNDGNANLVIGAIGSTDPLAAPFSLKTDTCSNQTIAPASSCTLSIEFAPSSTGAFTDSFNIPSNDSTQSTVTLSVSGSGSSTAVANISIADTVAPADDLSIPYGSVSSGRTTDQYVTVTNNGGSSLIIGTVGSANPVADPFSIVFDGCSGLSLAAGETCSLTVRFTSSGCSSDSGTSCNFSDSFDIPSDDPDTQSVTIQLSGTSASSHHNNPPGKFKLHHPADREEHCDTTVDMRWERSEDPDGDEVRYEVHYSHDNNFASEKIAYMMPPSMTNGKFYAGAGMGFIFFGVALAGTVRNRKRLLIIAAILVLTGAALVGCSAPTVSAPATSSGTEVSKQVTGLETSSTYYWKVVASDGNGGVTESDVFTFTTN